MPKFDSDLIQQATQNLLLGIGEDPAREGLSGTPDRVARAWGELTAGYHLDPREVLKTDFESEGYDQMVACRQIEFWSLCEHHLLPFMGTAVVAYIPDKRVIGLSKLARLVDVYARRLQIQERMTNQIAQALVEIVGARGVGVVVTARHLCMAARGVGKQQSDMVTSSLHGIIKEDPKARGEFMSLAGH